VSINPKGGDRRPGGAPKAIDCQATFPEVFAEGGFDVVVGDPPYVRQELLSPFKQWLEAHYEVLHGIIAPGQRMRSLRTIGPRFVQVLPVDQAKREAERR
jgi:hypothetical protein